MREKKGYFYEQEEQAVIDYVKETNQGKRNKIYNTILAPCFEKMINSIMRRYKLFTPEESEEDTYSDTLSYLLMQLIHFKPDKGKAYSYCQAVVKHYLLYKRKRKMKEQERYESFERNYSEQEFSKKMPIDPYAFSFKECAPILIEKTIDGITEMCEKPQLNDLSENEVKVGIALVDLLSNWEKIMEENGSNKLNKSLALYYLRETTMMTTKEVRENMKKFTKIYEIFKDQEMR